MTLHTSATVAIVRCSSYDTAAVLSAVRTGFDLIGGAASLFRPGERILLKPNVLLGNPPERSVTTHPVVFRAAATMLRESGVVLSYGDAPAGLFSVLANMVKSLIAPVADELSIPLADFEKGQWVPFPQGKASKNLFLANGVLVCDAIVGLPKLKTHGLTRFTGAVKNQFGCVPGTVKGEHHARHTDPYDFARLLVDIATRTRPRLCIMDGIMAMEGNGPQSGTPKHLGIILMSTDPVALDAVACRIIGLDPEFVPTNTLGEEAGLGVWRPEAITIVGESIESVTDRSFDVVRKPPQSMPQGRLLRMIKNKVTMRPAIDAVACIRCGRCVEICPVKPKALVWTKAGKKIPPAYDYHRCIRCFCCQEICPEAAIRIATPRLIKLLPLVSYMALLVTNIRLHRRRT
jgi:uncharacterized protein (DUF362 family)/Pyruvate/2-oxoacid:ferredoxin oxidoreductase delta subunit